MSNGREAAVIDTFLTLTDTDTLVTDFDALDMLTALAGRDRSHRGAGPPACRRNQAALLTSRTIGVALGIVMARRRITE